MSWLFKKKDDRYRVYSTVVGSFLSDWLDRQEVIRMIYEDKFRSFKLNIIEMYMQFPNMRGLYNPRGGPTVIMDKERGGLYQKWRKELASKNEMEYEGFIEAKYQEAIEFIKNGQKWTK